MALARAFVIRPFGSDKKDSAGKVLDFERVHKDLIGPALLAAGLEGSTTGEIIDAGNIREDMFSLILEADLIICDVTIHNANVFYELGIRHALRKRRTVLIKGEKAADNVPFDLSTDRYCPYDVDNPAAALPKLIEVVNATLHSDRETDSPIFKLLPALAEADPNDVIVVPLDFREEVERAHEVQSKGWLRLLAQDVMGRRFQWPGLKMIAKAQWDVRDFAGAQDSYERIREMYADDTEANLALANIYERMHRVSKNADLLKKSDLALERVLDADDLSTYQRAENTALMGRNDKTRWRLVFEGLSAVAGRREAAMNKALRDSYKIYRDAFQADLNHFYSGLAAFQMATIFLELSADEGDELWMTTFDDNDEAQLYRKKMESAAAELRVNVSASIEAELKRPSPIGGERVWAQVGAADLLFLTEKYEEGKPDDKLIKASVQRVVNKYKDALRGAKPFVWDAAKGQLELFAALGIREGLARQVINEVEAIFQPERKKEAQEKEEQAGEKKEPKPQHVIIFAGHRLDEKGREKPRFPAERAERARELIRAALAGLDDKFAYEGLASAAPGADILFHELCAELKIPTTLCLPMPSSDYARESFQDLDDWRTRYLNLTQGGLTTLTLSDRSGLPKWLADAGADPWERGNRWVMQMALTSGAKQVTLIALWDKEKTGDALGGTADMVKLAEDAGTVHVKVIDAKQLLD